MTSATTSFNKPQESLSWLAELREKKFEPTAMLTMAIDQLKRDSTLNTITWKSWPLIESAQRISKIEKCDSPEEKARFKELFNASLGASDELVSLSESKHEEMRLNGLPTVLEITIEALRFRNKFKDEAVIEELEATAKELSESPLEDFLVNGQMNWLRLRLEQMDLANRLQWLRSKEGDLHGILLYELGLAEFENTPSESTLFETTFPLFHAALFRLQQDSKTIKGECPPVGLIYDSKYVEILENKIEMARIMSSKELEEFAVQRASRASTLLNIKKVKETAEATLEKPVPLPTWVSSNFHANAEDIRQQFALKTIKRAEEEMQSLEA